MTFDLVFVDQPTATFNFLLPTIVLITFSLSDGVVSVDAHSKDWAALAKVFSYTNKCKMCK